MLETFQRPLTHREKTIIAAAAERLRRELGRLPKRIFTTAAIVTGVLWAITVAAVQGDWLAITIIWALLGGGIAVWELRSAMRRLIRRIEAFGRALEHDEARVVHIQTTEMIEFEERGSEGACYAFQVEPDEIVCIQGQEFYPTSRFPSPDLAFIDMLDDRGEMVYSIISKHGPKLAPLRIISVKARSKLRVPGNFEILHGRLADLEDLLAPGGSHGRPG